MNSINVGASQLDAEVESHKTVEKEFEDCLDNLETIAAIFEHNNGTEREWNVYWRVTREMLVIYGAKLRVSAADLTAAFEDAGHLLEDFREELIEFNGILQNHLDMVGKEDGGS
jgi:hypothetical protein